MKKSKLIVIMITILFIIGLFFAGKYTLDAIFGDACSNKINEEVFSPSGENVAYIFNRDCGATTGESFQLSIIDKDDKLKNKSGNTFRSDKGFTIEWLDEKQLVVKYNKSSKTYEMDKNVNGIKVLYVEK